MPLAMSPADLHRFLEEQFPQAAHLDLEILALDEHAIRLRLAITEQHLRPGGTVSGPTLMWLGDCGMYLLLLARLGPAATGAVTTGMTMNFLRKPEAVDLIAEANLLKCGRRLAVGDIRFFSVGLDEPVAQASLTYSIPPRK